MRHEATGPVVTTGTHYAPFADDVCAVTVSDCPKNVLLRMHVEILRPRLGHSRSFSNSELKCPDTAERLILNTLIPSAGRSSAVNRTTSRCETRRQIAPSWHLSLPGERTLVLVVDDERINREILSRMLSRNGHDVLTADSGEAVLERLEEQLPDLVLLDVIMSGISRFDVLKTIRSRYPDGALPVIMVTAEAERENVVRAFTEGANDYLTKPLDPQITLARISLHSNSAAPV